MKTQKYPYLYTLQNTSMNQNVYRISEIQEKYFI